MDQFVIQHIHVSVSAIQHQEMSFMSRRSPSTRNSSNTPNEKAGATMTAPASSNSPAAPSLESLLKSCGALQSVIRQKPNTVETDELDAQTNDFGEAINRCETDSQADRNSIASDSESETKRHAAGTDGSLEEENASSRILTESTRVTGVSHETTDSLNLLSILQLMREESRASIQELKASQEATAAGQSAVLKALFEVISRSSSARDNVSDSIEEKLFEFEERIVQRIGHVNSSASVTTAIDSKQLSEAASPSKASAKSGGRSWEEIRNDLLLNGDSRETQGETDIREANHKANITALDKSNLRETAIHLEVPKAVDPDKLSETELRQVFLEREEFISTLIGRLRQSHQQSSAHLPAEKLKSMGDFLPEDLAAQVMQTLHQLDELARIGELELSLERARLSRQVSKLEESRQLLEHHARQLGLTLTNDGTVSNPQKSVNRGTSSRRWLSKLGFGQ